MTLSIKSQDEQVLISEGNFTLRLDQTDIQKILSIAAVPVAAEAEDTPVVLDQHHPMWDHHNPSLMVCGSRSVSWYLWWYLWCIIE